MIDPLEHRAIRLNELLTTANETIARLDAEKASCGAEIERLRAGIYANHPVMAELRDQLATKEAELLACRAEWQPIETAPMDGSKILAWNEKLGARESRWEFYGDGSVAKKEFEAGNGPSGVWGWHEPMHNWATSWKPTHWMPLPPIDAIKAGAQS